LQSIKYQVLDCSMSEFEEKAVVKKSGDAAEDVNLVEVITSGGNARGIPSAVFIVSILCFNLL
jgi:hypothetical protein